ncbi:hypothetical protein Nmel_012692 [Mimus melanotis]
MAHHLGSEPRAVLPPCSLTAWPVLPLPGGDPALRGRPDRAPDVEEGSGPGQFLHPLPHCPG